MIYYTSSQSFNKQPNRKRQGMADFIRDYVADMILWDDEQHGEVSFIVDFIKRQADYLNLLYPRMAALGVTYSESNLTDTCFISVYASHDLVGTITLHPVRQLTPNHVGIYAQLEEKIKELSVKKG